MKNSIAIPVGPPRFAGAIFPAPWKKWYPMNRFIVVGDFIAPGTLTVGSVDTIAS